MSVRLPVHSYVKMVVAAAAIGVAFPHSSAVTAAEFLRTSNGVVRWDNTISYSAAARAKKQNQTLLNNINSDDGNRNFDKGVISNRLDLLSEFGMAYSTWGLEISGAAWFDSLYNQETDNTSPQTANSGSVPHTQFTKATKNLHGRKAELLNAYAYTNMEAFGRPLSFRLGRHTLLWGESLFFANNGVAAGMAPVDAIKSISVPGIRANEVFRPVGQASMRFQPSTRTALEVFYQFEWRKNRLPAAGSFFSSSDLLDDGGEWVFLSPVQFLTRSRDETPPDSGQFGAAFQYTGDALDVGFYALRFHAKDPQVYLQPSAAQFSSEARVREGAELYNFTPGPITSPGNSFTDIDLPFPNSEPGRVGGYRLVYPRGIQMFGASVSTYLGNSSIAGELSFRRHMPFISNALVIQPDTPNDDTRRRLHAVGNSLHGQVSTVTAFAPGKAWDSASLSLEVAFSHRMRVTRNEGALNIDRDKLSTAIRAVFAPEFFEVLPGLSLSFPVGIGYGISGDSSTDGSQNAKTGDLELSVRGTYRTVWAAELSYTSFFGASDRQAFSDRDFISVNVRRTF